MNIRNSLRCLNGDAYATEHQETARTVLLAGMYAPSVIVRCVCCRLAELEEENMIKTDESALDEQVGWIPRKMFVDGQDFEVQLRPMWIDAQTDWCEGTGCCVEYFECSEDPDPPMLEFFEALKGCISIYFYGEERVVKVCVRMESSHLANVFPKTIMLPKAKQEGVDIGPHPGYVEWVDGRKQSVRYGSVMNLDDDVFDFVQDVMQKRSLGQAGQPAAPSMPERTATGSVEPAASLAVSVAVDEGAPGACRFRIKRDGESVEYEGMTYEFTEEKVWTNLRELINAHGGYVRCDKGLKKFFKSKDAKAFYTVAIQPKGVGRKGNGTYRLRL